MIFNYSLNDNFLLGQRLNENFLSKNPKKNVDKEKKSIHFKISSYHILPDTD